MIKVDKIVGRPVWVTVLSYLFKILTVLIVILVIPLIIINGVLIFQVNEKVPQFMGYSMLNVISGSMRETLEVGDMVIVQNIKEVKEQDIITFFDENTITTHRIVKIEKQDNGEKRYTTKGDNNNAEDKNKLKEEQIIGKVVFHISGLGRFCAFLQKPQGLILLVGLPIISISISKVFEIRFANKRAFRKRQRIEYMEKNKE